MSTKISCREYIDLHPEEWPQILALFCIMGGPPENWRAVALELPASNLDK